MFEANAIACGDMNDMKSERSLWDTNWGDGIVMQFMETQTAAGKSGCSSCGHKLRRWAVINFSIW